MTAGQLIDLLTEQDPSAAVVVQQGDGYAPIDGLRSCGPHCFCLMSRGVPDVEYDDDYQHVPFTDAGRIQVRYLQAKVLPPREIDPLRTIDTSLNSDVG